MNIYRVKFLLIFFLVINFLIILYYVLVNLKNYKYNLNSGKVNVQHFCMNNFKNYDLLKNRKWNE